jgi:hypothetical protein
METTLKKKLKSIHIGQDIWRIGAQRYMKDGRRHTIIYHPNGRTLYHLYDKDVKLVTDDWDGSVMNVNRHGNGANEAKVKIYILTTILDNRSNWCFDLGCTPKVGKLKVIYDNGMVKNIDFNGTFEKEELVSKRFMMPNWTYFNYDGMPTKQHLVQTFVNPIAYRFQ